MLDGARLTITSDPDTDGSDETGVFELFEQTSLEAGVETLDLIGPVGQQAITAVDKLPLLDIDGAGGFSLNAGANVETYTIDFSDFGGSTRRWGDGSADSQRDAEGEGPQRQLSVLHQYLRQGAFDSRNPIVLEFYEFSSSGVYSPIDVKPVNPSQRFDPTQRSAATFDGQLELRRIGDLESFVNSASGQQNDK